MGLAMERYLVELTIRTVVDADNPGRAADEVGGRLKKLLEQHDPLLLKSLRMEILVLPAQRTAALW